LHKLNLSKINAIVQARSILKFMCGTNLIFY